jgi:hypothetical protein
MTAFARLERSRRVDLAPLTAGVALVGALVVSAGPDDGVVLCPFRRCTGGYCPGCGATRAANRFVRGDIGASWSQHPWIVLAVVQMVVLAAAVALSAPPRRRARVRRAAIPLLVANSVLMVGIWIIRLSTGAIPTGWF